LPSGTYRKGVDHGLESKIDLAGANDFSDILKRWSAWLLSNVKQTYTGVVGLKQGNLDALILEIALGLGQVQRGVIRRGVPKPELILDKATNRRPFCNNVNSYQFVRKVILSVDILRDQSVSYKESVANSGVPVSALGGGRLRSMSFRWYYPDQVRPVFLRTAACCGALPVLESARRETTTMLPNTRLLH
jgi:hypothetical protein